MFLINKVRVYTFEENTSDKKLQENEHFSLDKIEVIGNSKSSICCFISCTTPISESKDYKTLIKVFEKLMMNISNIYIVNVNTCKSVNFIHFIQEFNFNKGMIFGTESIMNNFPLEWKMNEHNRFEKMHILMSDNLNQLVESVDKQYKQKVWESIQSFYKI